MYQPMKRSSDVDWPTTATTHAKVNRRIILALYFQSCKWPTASKLVLQKSETAPMRLGGGNWYKKDQKKST